MTKEEQKKQEATPATPETKAEAQATGEAKTEAPKEAKLTAAQKKKSKRRSVVEGDVHIQASYNNTIVSVSEPNGNIIAWSSSGASGFKGARKATPYAAQVAAENAIQKAKIYGLARVHVYINGVGSGREQAMRGITANQIEILSISDITSMPHNGCRRKKARRV